MAFVSLIMGFIHVRGFFTAQILYCLSYAMCVQTLSFSNNHSLYCSQMWLQSLRNSCVNSFPTCWRQMSWLWKRSMGIRWPAGACWSTSRWAHTWLLIILISILLSSILKEFFFFFHCQAYIKIYQGEDLPHPKSMLEVTMHVYWYLVFVTCHKMSCCWINVLTHSGYSRGQ